MAKFAIYNSEGACLNKVEADKIEFNSDANYSYIAFLQADALVGVHSITDGQLVVKER